MKVILSISGLIAAAVIAATVFIIASPAPMSADDFFSLCREGTPQEIKSAIQKTADPNARTASQEGTVSSPLIAAILNGKNNDPGVIAEFAARGADLNERDGESGFTALMYATAVDKPEIIRELIKNGADIEARDDEGCSALMYAITGNQPAAIVELVKNGADINARDSLGRSAFSLAITPNVDPRIIVELIKRGADVNEFASFKDDWRVRNVSILMLAIINRCDVDVISALVENGADVNAETKYGDTALMYAIAKNGDPKMTINLIERGADVNKKYLVHHGAAFQYTALMWAIVHRADIEVIRELINRGSDVNARTEFGPSALDCAKFENYTEAIAILKQHGAK